MTTLEIIGDLAALLWNDTYLRIARPGGSGAWSATVWHADQRARAHGEATGIDAAVAALAVAVVRRARARMMALKTGDRDGRELAEVIRLALAAWDEGHAEDGSEYVR